MVLGRGCIVLLKRPLGRRLRGGLWNCSLQAACPTRTTLVIFHRHYYATNTVLG